MPKDAFFDETVVHGGSEYAYFCRPVNRYFLEFQYVGTAYHGWQVQPNAHTVQADLNKALTIIAGTAVETTGAGRTDTGVHATQMFCHFDLKEGIRDEANFIYRINAVLPDDIYVKHIFAVPEDAHSRFDAIEREYLYRISTFRNPFELERAWFCPVSLNVDAMNHACQVLFDYSDFSAFSKSNTQVKTNLCKINTAIWERNNAEIHFTISADRFLRNMVRAIVGTLVEVGKGQLDAEGFRKVIESGSRKEAGYSVPAHGLYLTRITYPSQYFKSV